MRTSSLILFGALFAIGCASAPSFSKQEAASSNGMTPDGEDICALEGWYDDLECDNFCVQADPQCAQCAALPVCADGETQYDRKEDCPVGQECKESSICGVTIWCGEAVACTTVVPECDAGEEQFDTKEACGEGCREETHCGATVYCRPQVNCLAFPSCPPGTITHLSEDECPPNSSCTPSSICGQTIWCSEMLACTTVVPECADGEISFDNEADCGPGCREVTHCGATVYCQATVQCQAIPVCNPDETTHQKEADCPANAPCRESSICGKTIFCSSAAPSCPGDNPQGCVSGGCDAGFHCDTEAGGAPSACSCTSSGWVCTADLGGGVCVAD